MCGRQVRLRNESRSRVEVEELLEFVSSNQRGPVNSAPGGQAKLNQGI